MSKLLDFDPLGTNPDNLVVDAEYTLLDGGVGVIIPSYGPFYWDNTFSLTIVSTGEIIQKDDGRLRMYEPDLRLTTLVSREVTKGVVINIPQFSGELLLTCHFVGGSRGTIAAKILGDAVERANNITRSYDTIPHPDTYRAEYHQHNLTTIEDIDLLSLWTNGLSRDIVDYNRTRSSANSIDAKLNRVTHLVGVVRASINTVEDTLSSGITSEDLAKVRNTLEDTMETIVFNAEVIVDNSVRLSSLEEGLGSLLTLLGDRFDGMADSLDVSQGTAYTPVDNGTTVTPVPDEGFLTLVYTERALFGADGMPIDEFIVAVEDAQLVMAATYNSGFTADLTMPADNVSQESVRVFGTNIINVTEDVYFEIAVTSDTARPNNTDTYSNISVYIGTSVDTFESEISTGGVLIGTDFNYSTNKYVSMALAEGDYQVPGLYALYLDCEAPTVRYGVSYVASTKSIAVTALTSSPAEVSVDDLGRYMRVSLDSGVIPIQVAAIGGLISSQEAVNLNVSILTNPEEFAQPIPSGFKALSAIAYGTAPYVLNQPEFVPVIKTTFQPVQELIDAMESNLSLSIVTDLAVSTEIADGVSLSSTSSTAFIGLGLNVTGLTVKSYIELEIIAAPGAVVDFFRISVDTAVTELAAGLNGSGLTITGGISAGGVLTNTLSISSEGMNVVADPVNANLLRVGIMYDSTANSVRTLGDMINEGTYHETTTPTTPVDVAGTLPILVEVVGDFSSGAVEVKILSITESYPVGYSMIDYIPSANITTFSK